MVAIITGRGPRCTQSLHRVRTGKSALLPVKASSISQHNILHPACQCHRVPVPSPCETRSPRSRETLALRTTSGGLIAHRKPQMRCTLFAANPVAHAV